MSDHTQRYDVIYADSSGRECKTLRVTLDRSVIARGGEYPAVRTLAEKGALYKHVYAERFVFWLRVKRVLREERDGSWREHRWPIPQHTRIATDPSAIPEPPATWPNYSALPTPSTEPRL